MRRDIKLTLLDYYGPLFEAYHTEGCTCNLPIAVIISLNKNTKLVTNRCNKCGLVIHSNAIIDKRDSATVAISLR